MKYEFPEIENIADVLPVFDDKLFYKAEKEGYTVINYHCVSPETFPEVVDRNTSIMREFRGIIFDDSGKIVRRPYQKFFNVGERPETSLVNIDVSQRHVILDKLDGSMICPFIINGKLIWGTKLGYTDVTPQIEEFVSKNLKYEIFAGQMIANGYSPIFEWCSTKQRIVLEYKEDQLILIALRHIKTGEYMYYDKMKKYGALVDIPVVHVVDSEKLSQDFLDLVKKSEDIEGFVIRFDNGHMCKIKCDWYVQLHRVKADIAHERGVVNLILEQHLDDLKPLMTKEDLAYINDFESVFNQCLDTYIYETLLIAIKIKEDKISRKDFALIVSKGLTYWQTSVIFTTWDTQGSLREAVTIAIKSFLLKATNKQSKWEEMRKTFPNLPVWNAKVYLEE